jgi:hypothetical protein
VDPRLVLAPRPTKRARPRHVDAVEARRRGAGVADDARRSARPRTSPPRADQRGGLKRWTEWAVNLGAEFVIVDHIDRIDHGDGKNSFHEVSETVRLAKELAVEHGIVMLVASQVGRPSDAVEAFMPPALHNLRGAGTKEEEADTVLGIYRPLRADVGEKEIKRVRQGLANADTITEAEPDGRPRAQASPRRLCDGRPRSVHHPVRRTARRVPRPRRRRARQARPRSRGAPPLHPASTTQWQKQRDGDLSSSSE